MTHILLVDDDPVIQTLMTEYLRSLGHSLAVGGSGEEALRLVKEAKPEIIFLDLFMPDMTGIKVLQLLRADPETSPIPVVLLTADSDPQELLRKSAVKPDRYLQKPFSFSELPALIKELLVSVDGV